MSESSLLAVRVIELSLRRRANVSIVREDCACCGAVRVFSLSLFAKRSSEVVAWFARLLSQSRGGLKNCSFKRESRPRSSLLWLRLENGKF